MSSPINLDELVTIYRPPAACDKKCALLYLHGGGLLYGERDDLPGPYVRAITDAGYTLIAADYPLAPETPLPGIVEAIYLLWQRTIADQIANGTYASHALFGRSAGAFLSLVLAREIRRRRPEGPQPIGVLDFYGYYDLTEPWTIEPAAAYTKLPDIPAAQAQRMTATAPGTAAGTPTSAPKALRYALYVYARQHEGAWHELMGLRGDSPEQEASAWSLCTDDIKALPPLFITASTGDEDVPYRVSKQLYRSASPAVMKSVYYLPHDFDRDITDETGIAIYRAALSWLDALAPSPHER